MGMSEAFPYAIHAQTVGQLRIALKGLPDDMPVIGFYDDAFGIGIVWVQADDNKDGQYLAIDVEQERT